MHPTDDELHIDTPEQIALELPLAGIGSRLLAMTLDTLLQGVLYAALGLIAFVPGHQRGHPLAGVVRSPLRHVRAGRACVRGLLPVLGYFAYFETAWHGQTPGKRYTHIRVIKETGRPINAFEAVGRNLMRAIDDCRASTVSGSSPCSSAPSIVAWATTSPAPSSCTNSMPKK